MENENKQRAILGGGCITLIIAVILLLVSLLCAMLDKICGTV